VSLEDDPEFMLNCKEPEKVVGVTVAVDRSLKCTSLVDALADSSVPLLPGGEPAPVAPFQIVTCLDIR
jgi:hypothetical protein